MDAGDRMTEAETLIWRGEHHPRRSSTICLLMTLDRVPGWDRLRAVHERASRLLPRARAHVLEPAVPVGPPAWVPDPDFDLDHHLRRARLPAPAGMDRLLEYAQCAALTPFDRGRPLWEGTLLTGLAGGRAAYLLKTHHCLTDAAAGTAGSGLDSWTLAAGELAEQAAGLPVLAGELATAGAHALTHPQAVAGEALRFAASLRHAAAARFVPGSVLFRGRTGRPWRFGVLDCELSALRAAGLTAGATADDAYLAALLGGLRLYHERHGLALDEVPTTMPVGQDGTASALFAGPSGVTDPQERIAVVRGVRLSLGAEPALNGAGLLAPVLNRLPSVVGAAAGLMSASADLAVAGMPGACRTTGLAGARVERVYPFGPLPGAAVLAAMTSHGGACRVGLTMDGSVISDPGVLVGCVRRGFEEVLSLA